MFKFNQKKRVVLITKRHKFIIGVLVSSFLLFIAERLLGKSGLLLVGGIAYLTDLFLFWAMRKDLKDNFTPQIFIMPFMFTLAFGAAFFLFPPRLIVGVFYTLIYAIALYSLYLCQNIFTVSSIRTIALLSSARTVSFVLTILTFLGMVLVIFTLQLNVLITIPLIFLGSFPLIIHSIWTYTLDKSLMSEVSWGLILSLCILEVSFLLWFWPALPIIAAIFLTGFLYTILGLSHHWFERRLFRGVMLEYLFWSAICMFVLVAFTSWT